MSVKGLIVGVDLDGVCADFYARMREITAEWLEKPLEQLTEDVSFDLNEWGVTDYEQLHRFAVTQRDLFGSSKMVPGARTFLRRLSDQDARIRIITHRLCIPYFHAVAVSQTTEWLDLHGIPYWDLCFMRDKPAVGADVYVDDAPKNVLALREEGCPTICFGNSTNRHIDPPPSRRLGASVRTHPRGCGLSRRTCVG